MQGYPICLQNILVDICDDINDLFLSELFKKIVQTILENRFCQANKSIRSSAVEF
jgi:hypothetical protein